MIAASSPPARSSTEARFKGRWLPAARWVWLLVAFTILILFLLNVLAPAFGGKATLCPFSSACGYASTTRQALHHAGITPAAFNGYLLGLSLFDALVTVGLGVLIFWTKSDHPSSWLASLVLLLLGGGLLTGNANSSSLSLQALASDALTFAFVLAIGFFIVTFPDGRLAPRWSWLAGSTIFIQALLYQLPGAWYLERWPAPLYILETLLAFGSPVAILIYRYFRVFGPAQRKQTKWVVFALVCVVLISVLQALVEAVFPALNKPASLYPLVSASLIPSLTGLCIPAGISIAVLRSGLWDIDALINRTLVYGSLTVLLGFLYVFGVVALQAVFRTASGQGSGVAVAISTLAIAALFQPLRHRIQSFIDRRFYRRKYDAVRTLAQFGERVRDDVDLDTLTSHMLGVVQETMQPAHVSLWLRREGRS